MKKLFYLTILVLASVFLMSCVKSEQSWAVRMADSDMKRFPEGWQLDYRTRKLLGYAQAVECQAILQVWNKTNDNKYYDYVFAYYDGMIDDNGVIMNYKRSDYNADMVNAGKNIITFYEITKNDKFRKAADTLRKQMSEQPRTPSGGFWHKKIYQNQMWLDGLYMYGPFLAQYAATFNEPALFDEVINQIILVGQQTKDEKTGLYTHAWDESKQQRWSDPETGKSHNFWGRSIGWYLMAIVDVLDYLPENYPGRQDVLTIFTNLIHAMLTYQDATTGLWHQVVDQRDREGNYLEASISAMMAYAISKGVNKGYLEKEYKKAAEKTFDGILSTLIRENEDGTISLTKCCAVAGLGGNPYRDGTYEYYINEQIRDDDPKGNGPFIMAALQLNK
jgi:unsaturated rhamnogalacturonyl hydrolase